MTSPARPLVRVAPWVFSALALTGIAVLAWHYAGPQVEGEGLDAELNAPALFSTLLLLAAGLATLAASRCRPPGSWARRAFAALAGLQTLLALDEGVSIHEALERWTGVDWVILYLPVGLVGLVTGLAVLRAVRRSWPTVTLYVVAAGCWAVAQVLETVQWKGETLVRPALVYPEELLEMTGSALFTVAALLVLRAFVEQGPQDRRPTETPAARVR